MAILLRVLIILLLVLSIVALGFGVKLFYQRDVLKARTQLLAEKVLEVAKTIEAENADDLAAKGQPTMDTKIKPNDLMTFAMPGAAQGTNAAGTMQGALNLLVGQARVQLGHLNETRDDLGQTRTTLAQTKEAKEKTEADLAAEKKTTKEQEQKIATQTDEIKQKGDSIAQLEESNKGLKEKGEEQDQKIAKLQDDNRDLLEAKKQDAVTIKDLLRKIAQGPGSGTEQKIPPGLKGQVLIVNPKWNFVILGLAPDSEVTPTVELIVHRGDKFVGKIRVSEVKGEGNLAVAEIMNDWQKMPIAEGDYVIY